MTLDDETSGADLEAVAAGLPRAGPTQEIARARVEQSLFAAADTPTQIGRYLLLGTLGRGGMGVVYSAYDPELDRKVAIKLLNPSAAEQGSRLVREAQALAKLTHPNVVGVHDVGTAEGAVFVAMEYVEGVTLTAWLAERTPAWHELLPVLVQAARGLLAAHEVGLVHRDFKPDNVMLDRAGRVLVMDFGLARTSGDVDESRDTRAPTTTSLRGGLTRTGTILGTPAYMAPEQFIDAGVDARSDQFSFCIAAWEALYGQRPFAGKSLPELSAAVLDGRIDPPPRSARAPAWLHRVLLRGLAVDPSQRWPSMRELELELERGHARARLRRGGIALLGVGAIVAATYGAQQWDLARRRDACAERGVAIVSGFDETSREQVQQAILATGVGHAAATAEKTMPWLDLRAQSLRDAATEACERAEVRDAWSRDTIERAEWCLDERRAAFDALVQELSAARPELVHGAIEAAATLPDGAPCTQEDLLERVLVPAEGDRDRVYDVHQQLARAAAVRVAARYDESLALSREALASAEAIGWTPLVAKAQLQTGRDLASTDAHDEAEAMLEEAYFTGARAGAADVAADAASALVLFVGRRRERPIDALRWARLAEREVANDGDTATRVAMLASVQGIALEIAGRYDEALASVEEALRLREAAFGAQHPLVAASITDLAIIHRSRGDRNEARELYERALELNEQIFGPEHPNVAACLNNLGTLRGDDGDLQEAAELHLRAAAIAARVPGLGRAVQASYLGNAATQLQAMGDLPRAKAMTEDSIAVLEDVYGPEHAAVGRRYTTLGAVLKGMRDFPGSRAAFERSLAILEANLGPKHPDVGVVLYNIADVDYELDEIGKAKAGFERALAILEPALGEEHPTVLTTLGALANAEKMLFMYPEAQARLERVLAIQERTLGRDHADLSYPLLSLGNLAREAGKYDEAVAAHTRTLQLREAHQLAPAEIAEAHWYLARSLWDAKERERARVEAERARDLYASVPGRDSDVSRTTKWLAEHTVE